MYPGAYLDTTAHKPAVIMADTGRTVTFAELEANSIRIARHLRTLGLRRGDHVAVLATNTPRVFDIYWAAMRSGLYVTMVNWHLTPGEAAYIVDDCGAKAVLVDAALEEIARVLPTLLPNTEHRLAFGGTLPGYADLDAAAAAESDAAPADQPRGRTCSTRPAPRAAPRASSPRCPTARSTNPVTR